MSKKKNRFTEKIGISLKLSPDFFVKIILVLGVIMVWRGIWNILDEYLFPDQPLFSNLISILLGLFLIYLPDKNLDQLN